MRFRLLFALLINSISIIAQQPNGLNALGKTHVLIRGTNISMAQPKAFVASENFQGFKNPNDPNTMIMVSVLPGPFAEISKGFNAETMKSRGIVLKEKNTILIDRFEGLILEVTQPANGLQYAKTILVFGDSSNTTMINGIALEDSIETRNQIRASIYSTIINENLQVDPRAELDYTLDESAGGFQLVTVVNNLMLFNRDGKKPTESPDKVVLLSDKSYLKTQILDKKAFCISRLKQYPENYALIEKSGVQEIQINGLKGYELYALSTENAAEEMYQVALFQEDGGYFLLVATYLKGNETAIADIKAIVKTFKLK